MRVFVAVFPPPEVQQALIEAARLTPTNAFRLTAPERVHLTLKFLGDVPPDSLPRITATLEPIRRDHEPFDVLTSSFGVFPSPRRARVLWAGLGEGKEQMRSLAQTVETLLEPEGFQPEKKSFMPHITLGRARRPTPFDPTGANLPELRFTVSAIDLVQSKHSPKGVAYSTLTRYEL
ncbi:RNA 2',3'-cyclic phosphodiesterase [Rubrobacter tropicus]|uniref:RNA 2',3'-cyclic phosphodiesterase n=1 Tax=Rubrobacter tropicus TaxID=2653851 RepID=UPI00140C38E2|nr:RNA 2',3'-cyclic phosphodiesterase [Rubrobacter tropicus]